MTRTYLYLVFNLISVHICQNCQNFSTYDVTFNSTNFEYILHWSKHDLGSDVSFNVQYKRYGQPEWLLLHDCQNITRENCNLTNAITGDEEHFMDNQYFGRVMALSPNCTSDWVTSKRLNPRVDTCLILPKLSYTPNVNSITILIPTPYIPIRGRDKQPVTVEDLYKNDTFEYHLIFLNSEKQVKWQKTQTERLFKVTGLSPGIEYNVTVYISIDNERKSDKQFFVVRTLPDYSMVILVTSLVAVFVIALCAGFFLLSYKYVKQRVNTPNSLVFQKSTTLPLLTLSKDKVISTWTLGFCPAMQNYEQKHQETSRKIWQDIPGDLKLHTYARQSHGAVTPEKDSEVDIQESYCPQRNMSSLVSSVHYGKVLDMTTSNVTYLQNTTPSAYRKVSHECEGEFQINTQPFLDYDEDVSNAFIGNSFKFNLFSSLLSGESNNIPNSMSPIGLISSVTIKDYGDFPAPMEQTEEPSPVLLSDLYLNDCTSNRIEELNLQHMEHVGHDDSSYILQCPVENFTTKTFVKTTAYKQQCGL
ncbi:interleukin-22 receptor subunit alpha-1 [Hyla sarda]|uniref:interleukin-22 receptor subunit alpha-1 n=1 Tax=Hyla sarda TaxID=327740 RepID=UPI0024C24B96|nr:interleukin-22 receptor subunit alpha-1 [Hyla sarda]